MSISIAELCRRIVARPGIYLPRESIDGLYHFLHGVEYAAREMEPGWDDPTLHEFQLWIEDRYGLGRTPRGWAMLITERCGGDDRRAFFEFRRLFQIYLGNHGDPGCPAPYSSN